MFLRSGSPVLRCRGRRLEYARGHGSTNGGNRRGRTPKGTDKGSKPARCSGSTASGQGEACTMLCSSPMNILSSKTHLILWICRNNIFNTFKLWQLELFFTLKFTERDDDRSGMATPGWEIWLSLPSVHLTTVSIKPEKALGLDHTEFHSLPNSQFCFYE